MTGGTAADWRSAIRGELEQMEDDLHYTERTHFEMEKSYRSWHTRGGMAAAALAAVAGATVITESSPFLAGLTALCASVISAVMTFKKPERAAEQHLTAGRQLSDIRTRLRHTKNVDLDRSEYEPMREALEELRAEKSVVDQASPGTSDRHFKRARKQIQAGLYEKDVRPPSP